MSLLLDDREEPLLLDHLSRFGLPVTVCRLDYGEGSGRFSAGDLVIRSPDGRMIGYERKKLDDLIKCMQDRRLAGSQLRNCWKVYDRVELVLEAVYRPGANGEIEIPRAGSWRPYFFRGSGISYRQLDSFLYSQYECGGVPCWRTGSTAETAHLYASRWHWWQKDYDLHRSHDQLFTNDPKAQRRGAVLLHQGDANPVTLWAAQIPGIDAKAWDVGKQFSSPRELANAGPEEWRQVTWTDRKGNIKRFGKDSALKFDAWLRGESVNGSR